MAETSTVYDVKVRYTLDDKASKGLTGVAAAAEKAHEGVFSLKHVVEGLALKEVFSLGKEALIDFNSEIDQMKIGMTTVMQMNLHMPFEKANKEADKLFETFQALAKKSPLTTKDFMEMATAISPTIAMAGGGPEKLAKITSGALTAGLAYGQRADIVAMDVQEMMMGNVTKKNRLGNELLGSIGMDHEEFNKKSATDRAKLVEQMFDNPGLQKAAERFGDTFKGQTSTFKDNLQIALGQVGRPLMEAMTAEAKKINMWVEKNPKAIKEYVAEFGEMIKGTFTFIKNAAGWLVDNRELIFTLAKTFLVFKGAQIGTNILKKFAEGAAGLVDKLKSAGSDISGIFSSENGISGRLGAMGSMIGKVIPALGLFSGALEIATHFLSLHTEDDQKAHSAKASLHEAVGDFPEMMARRKQLQEGLAGKGLYGAQIAGSPELKERYATELSGLEGKLFDPQKMGEALRKISDESAAHGGSGFQNATLADMNHAERYMPNMYEHNAADNEKITKEVLSTLDMFKNWTLDQRREAMKYAFPEQWGTPTSQAPAAPAEDWKPGKNADVNITIQKIEVASEDPDRFVFGLVKVGEQATKHKTSSQHATAGGF